MQQRTGAVGVKFVPLGSARKRIKTTAAVPRVNLVTQVCSKSEKTAAAAVDRASPLKASRVGVGTICCRRSRAGQMVPQVCARADKSTAVVAGHSPLKTQTTCYHGHHSKISITLGNLWWRLPAVAPQAPSKSVCPTKVTPSESNAATMSLRPVRKEWGCRA